MTHLRFEPISTAVPAMAAARQLPRRGADHSRADNRSGTPSQRPLLRKPRSSGSY